MEIQHAVHFPRVKKKSNTEARLWIFCRSACSSIFYCLMENWGVFPIPKISHCTPCHSSLLLWVLLRSGLWRWNSLTEFIMLCRRAGKKIQYISAAVRLVQVTSTEAEVWSYVHSKKLKSCFALRMCQFFSHPARNALTMQITIH